MKKTRLTRDEQALRAQLEGRLIPEPSEDARGRVLAAAQAFLPEFKAEVKVRPYRRPRSKLALSLSVSGALAATLFVVAIRFTGAPEDTAPANPAIAVAPVGTEPTSVPVVAEAPGTGESDLLNGVDRQLGKARTRLAALRSRTGHSAYSHRPTRSESLLARTGKLRTKLARQGGQDNAT